MGVSLATPAPELQTVEMAHWIPPSRRIYAIKTDRQCVEYKKVERERKKEKRRNERRENRAGEEQSRGIERR